MVGDPAPPAAGRVFVQGLLLDVLGSQGVASEYDNKVPAAVIVETASECAFYVIAKHTSVDTATPDAAAAAVQACLLFVGTALVPLAVGAPRGVGRPVDAVEAVFVSEVQAAVVAALVRGLGQLEGLTRKRGAAVAGPLRAALANVWQGMATAVTVRCTPPSDSSSGLPALTVGPVEAWASAAVMAREAWAAFGSDAAAGREAAAMHVSPLLVFTDALVACVRIALSHPAVDESGARAGVGAGSGVDADADPPSLPAADNTELVGPALLLVALAEATGSWGRVHLPMVIRAVLPSMAALQRSDRQGTCNPAFLMHLAKAAALCGGLPLWAAVVCAGLPQAACTLLCSVGITAEEDPVAAAALAASSDSLIMFDAVAGALSQVASAAQGLWAGTSEASAGGLAPNALALLRGVVVLACVVQLSSNHAGAAGIVSSLLAFPVFGPEFAVGLLRQCGLACAPAVARAIAAGGPAPTDFPVLQRCAGVLAMLAPVLRPPGAVAPGGLAPIVGAEVLVPALLPAWLWAFGAPSDRSSRSVLLPAVWLPYSGPDGWSSVGAAAVRVCRAAMAAAVEDGVWATQGVRYVSFRASYASPRLACVCVCVSACVCSVYACVCVRERKCVVVVGGVWVFAFWKKDSMGSVLHLCCVGEGLLHSRLVVPVTLFLAQLWVGRQYGGGPCALWLAHSP